VTFKNVGNEDNRSIYNYKVLTMSNSMVREEYSFTFQKPEQDVNNKQMLIVSRDLNKLMEVYGDSKCRIFTKRQEGNKKSCTWTLTHNIKKFPSSL